MGVEPFLAASTVNVAVGQRLLRMICDNCKAAKQITDAEFQALAENLPPELLDNHRKEINSLKSYISRINVELRKRNITLEVPSLLIFDDTINKKEEGFEENIVQNFIKDSFNSLLNTKHLNPIFSMYDNHILNLETQIK
jgi:type II secretory ATPase GspE/PulE/Tfp pilus assembly ATPase PilB-like protein